MVPMAFSIRSTASRRDDPPLGVTAPTITLALARPEKNVTSAVIVVVIVSAPPDTRATITLSLIPHTPTYVRLSHEKSGSVAE